MSVRIITDSTSDCPERVREHLTVVPLTVHFGEEEYIDGVTITHAEFYRKLAEGSVLPTTSQATPDNFDQVFRKVVETGDTAVVITIASEMSGTCQSAAIAASEYPGKIFVVDSSNVTIGAGVLVTRAFDLAQQGLSAEEIAAKINEEKKNVRVLAILDTLEYLKRGGRISRTAAFAGGILSIKPLVSVKNGVIEAIGKARGVNQGIETLIKAVADAGMDESMPACLGYTGTSSELLDKFRKVCAERNNPLAELPEVDIGSVVGTHAGPGAYAAAFFVRN